MYKNLLPGSSGPVVSCSRDRAFLSNLTRRHRKADSKAHCGPRVLGQGERRTAGGRGADAKAKLTRLYEAIVNGPTDLDDANLKGRIAELRRIRDAARATRGRPRSDLLSRFADEARRGTKAQDDSFQATSRPGACAAGGDQN